MEVENKSGEREQAVVREKVGKRACRFLRECGVQRQAYVYGNMCGTAQREIEAL